MAQILNIDSEIRIADRLRNNLLSDMELSSSIYASTVEKYKGLSDSLAECSRYVKAILLRSGENYVSDSSSAVVGDTVSKDLYDLVKEERDRYLECYQDLLVKNSELSLQLENIGSIANDVTTKSTSTGRDVSAVDRHRDLDRSQKSRSKSIITSVMADLSDSVNTTDPMYNLCIFLENWYIWRFVSNGKVPSYDLNMFPNWLCKLVLNFVVADSSDDQEFFDYFNDWIEESNSAMESKSEIVLKSLPDPVFNLSYYDEDKYVSNKFQANTIWKNLVDGPLYGLQEDNTRSAVFLSKDDMQDVLVSRGWLR